MLSKSRTLFLLLGGMLVMLACQFLSPAPQSCVVHLPSSNRGMRHLHGETIAFTVDGMDWTAQVDCKTGKLVDGQPVRPQRAREVMIPVADSAYRLITSDPSISMKEYRANGSHIRIEMDGRYYVAALYADPGSFGRALVSYFIGGQAVDGMLHMHCYNRSDGQDHISLPVVAASWVVDKPATVALICAADNFILELSTEITSITLQQGPTPVPPTPGPTITPEPPGYQARLNAPLVPRS